MIPTPKQKAKELVEKFIEPTKVPNIKMIWVEDLDAAKQCALILVDEVLDVIDWDYYEGSAGTELNWWKEVKKEIENI